MKYKLVIYQIILDILFYLSFFSFLHYSRNKIYEYMNLIRSYAPDLLQLQETLKNSNQIESLVETELLLKQVNNIVNKSILFGYLIMPLIFFIIIVIFWSLIYGIIKNENLRDYRYYLRFGIITLPFYILFILVFKNIIDMINLVPFYGDGELKFYHIVLLILPIVIYYFLQIAYGQTGNLKQLYKNSIKSVKKLELIPLMLIQFTLQLIVFILASLNYIMFIAKEISYKFLIFLFVFLLFFNVYRSWLIGRIKN